MDKIYVIYGDKDQELARTILQAAQVHKDLPQDKNALIGIKPNLVLASSYKNGATTSPYLVEGLIDYLQDLGYKNLVIMEGSWVGDRTARAFEVCGYNELSRKTGVPLVDLQKDSYKTYPVGDIEVDVCDRPMEADYLINMPVLKGHCQTRITCALKNMKGCIPDTEKRRFHGLGLHKPIGYLNSVLKQDLILVDGIYGDLNFEEGGNPLKMNRVLLAKDPVLLDSYVAELLGYDKDQIPYIDVAEDMGVGKSLSSYEQVIELNKEDSKTTIPKTRDIKRLARLVTEDSACSACYASLIHALDRLDERGRLHHIKEDIHIGQGYKEKSLEGLGIGICTRNFESFVPGCPPRAREIIRFIEDQIDNAK